MVTAIPGSIADEDAVLVPIRMVEAMLYCPRQAWYRFTLGDDPLNVHMERGLRRHQVMDEARPETPEGVTFRHLPVYAPRLGVRGVIDEVIVTPAMVTITEYKAGKAPPVAWLGVMAQVIVQALALREHAARVDWSGPSLPADVRLRAFFSDSRRYRDVPWTGANEALARAALRQARALVDQTSPPAGLVGPRCRHCQHEPICLPDDLPRWVAAAQPMREAR
ncbi:MAG: Dna2/Cas4 domain-containing protein [Chloroflexi bacterium]|nr:Dna2/Cas4 domain-containing protein [Chloroflexota bacterium]